MESQIFGAETYKTQHPLRPDFAFHEERIPRRRDRLNLTYRTCWLSLAWSPGGIVPKRDIDLAAD